MEPLAQSSLLQDILWADPISDKDSSTCLDYYDNKARGCSVIFGPQVTNEFLFNNKLVSIIRGHEAKLEGF